MNVEMVAVAGDEASPPLAPSSEIGMTVQMVAFAVKKASPPLAPASSEIGMKVQMIAVAGDEASPPLVPSSSEIGMKVQMIAVAGDETYPPLAPSSEIGMNVQMIAVAGDETYPPLAPSSEIGMNVQMIAVAGDETYPSFPRSFQTIDVAGDETYPPLAPSTEIGMNVQMISVAGDEASPVLAPSSEIGIDIQMFRDGGDEADRFPPLPLPEQRIPPSLMMAAVAENDADSPPAPSAEIGINVQKLSAGGLEAESQLPRPFHKTPPSSLEAVMNFQMTAVAGDEAEPEAPSEVTTGLTDAFAGGEEAGRDPPRPLPAVHRLTPASIMRRGVISKMLSLREAGAIYRRWLNRIRPSASRLTFNTFGVTGAGEESDPATVLPPETGMRSNALSISGDDRPPPAGFPMLPEGGDGANGDPPLPPPETGVRFNAFSISVGGRPPANGEPPLPPPVDRFMRFRIYASIPAISGTCIRILADIMDPTTENKKLIGVSMMSLIGNVVTSSWLIFRGGDLPNDDWKNIIFKITFVFTGTLTLYASFSTLSPNWFTLPGIVLCGALAVGLGHSDGLKRLCKKFIATIKNATQKIQELIA